MKDIHWLVNRLKSMNAPEVAWRVQQKLLQKKEKKSVYSLHLPVTQIPLSKELESLSADANRIPFNPQNDNISVFKTLDIFGQFDYQLYKKKWNAGFQTENTWPEKDFSAGISIGQREDIGDIRTNWELNRHFQFVGLAKNYYLTGNIEYLQELDELFGDWNAHNLFLHGVEWTSAMEIGIRANSWIFTYVFLEKTVKKYGQENNGILDELCHGIKGMVDYIVKHRARFSSANNHLIIEMYAVGLAGFLFNYGDWIELSIKVLTEELPRQNFKDGVNKEMSLHYQSFVMEAYGLLSLVMIHNERVIPLIWKQYLTSMSKFLADCCGDYGEVIVFGDNDEGKISDLQGKIEDHYRYVLQLMGMLLEYKYIDLPLIENLEWIINKKQKHEYSLKKLYMPGLVSHYELGGYTILRSKDRKVLLAMDHAELGFGSLAAHGHCDALSIQAFYEGNPVLIDSGTYNYHVPKTIRNEVRSTKAHNTVYVEGVEQAEMLGPFLWGKRYKVEEVSHKVKPNHVIVEASIIYNEIKHRRVLEYHYDKEIRILDYIDGHKDGFYLLWNFACCSEEAIKLIKVNNELINKYNNRCLTSSIRCSDRYNKEYTGTLIQVYSTNKTETKILLT